MFYGYQMCDTVVHILNMHFQAHIMIQKCYVRTPTRNLVTYPYNDLTEQVHILICLYNIEHSWVKLA